MDCDQIWILLGIEYVALGLFCSLFLHLKNREPPWILKVGCKPLNVMGVPGPICSLSSDNRDQWYAQIEREGRNVVWWRTLAPSQCVEMAGGWNTPLRPIWSVALNFSRTDRSWQEGIVPPARSLKPLPLVSRCLMSCHWLSLPVEQWVAGFRFNYYL